MTRSGRNPPPARFACAGGSSPFAVAAAAPDRRGLQVEGQQQLAYLCSQDDKFRLPVKVSNRRTPETRARGSGHTGQRGIDPFEPSSPSVPSPLYSAFPGACMISVLNAVSVSCHGSSCCRLPTFPESRSAVSCLRVTRASSLELPWRLRPALPTSRPSCESVGGKFRAAGRLFTPRIRKRCAGPCPSSSPSWQRHASTP